MMNSAFQKIRSAAMKLEGGFIKNLGRVYGVYTLGFLGFVILMAILEQAGVSAEKIGWMFVGFTIAIYALIGILSRTMESGQYYVAGREVPAVYNGMATAADWMSGASFIAMAGGIYMNGYPYMAFLVGWTGGYVLVASLIAPYLRKFGCYTVPDFIGTRYGGNLARFCAVIVLVMASFTYVTAQINGTGTVAARMLDIPFEWGVWVGLSGILACSMLGGMRAVTWTQVAQYIVLIVAYLIPVFWMSNKLGYGMIPHLAQFDAVLAVQELEQLHNLGAAVDPAAQAAAGKLKALSVGINDASDTLMAKWKFFTLVLCMMLGTASLPHVLMRYFTTASVKAARQSVGWSLVFICLLYLTAPALATFTKLSLLDPNLATGIIGKSFADAQSLEWVQKWTSAGFLKLVDGNGDGILQLQEFFMNGQIVVLAIAVAWSQYLYYKIIDPKADSGKRLVVARILLLAIGAAGAYVAAQKLTGILGAVAWAFCFANSGLFFPLVLGIWWKRANRAGAIAGMIGGLTAGTAYLYAIKWGGMDPWLGIDHLRFGMIGMPVSLILMIVVSKATEAPDEETMKMVDSIRIPKGEVVQNS